MAHDPEIIFAVRRLPDGGLWVDWHPDIYPAIDDDGKDADRLIDIAEELIEAANGEPDETP